MKRVLSLVLALVIVLGTMPMAFAADETAGEMLQAAGFVAGDENGNLMEDKGLTRAELAVLVAELNGVKENAKTYAIAPEFKDVKADDWFGPYVAYAAKEGWFKGDDMGNFNPLAPVSDQAMATVMLRALGYDPAWTTAVSEAKAMGLPVGAADAAMMTRGEAFTTMWAVVNTPKQGSDVALGVELGKLEPEAPEVVELVAEIDGVQAIANNLVEVEFAADVDAAAAGAVENYSVVTKAGAEEVAVVAVTVESATVVVVETEALESGDAYTMVVGEEKANFTGVAKETSAPEVDSVKGTDEGRVEVEFDMMVDKATAEDVANYSIDKEGTVVAASLNSDRDTVELTVEGFKTSSAKKLTVENVTNTDGVVMKKVTRTFAPKYDSSAPKLDDVNASSHNNVEVLVDFSDSHGIDKATAEDVSNYEIDGLEIISAMATYQDDDEDDYYDRVILTTSEQTKSTNYTLKVKYMLDGSAAANATTKVLDETFRGGKVDDDAPEVKNAEYKTLTEVHVVFTEENALDLATALDSSNYRFDDDSIDVFNVELKDADDNGNDYYKGTGTDANDDITVILTVTEMDENETYKLYIDNISDNFGNTMDDEAKESVRTDDEDVTAPFIERVETTDDLTIIKVVFNEDVKTAGAEDPTNYVLDGGIGAATSADLDDDDRTVELEVAKLTVNKTYEITVNGVANYWTYVTEDVTKKFVATPVKADTDQPEVEDVDFDDKGILRITFNESMSDSGTPQIVVNDDKEEAKTLNHADGVVLDFVTLEGDNDEIMVFDASDANTTLANDTKYYIAGFSAKDGTTNAVKDLAGFTVDYDAADEYFNTDDAYDADDVIEVEKIYQEDGRTIHVYFSDHVEVKVATISSLNTGDAVYDFDVDDDSDEDDLIVLTLQSGTDSFSDEEEELKFNFKNVIGDVIGRTVKDETVDVDVDNDDDNGPTISEVKVIDNETLEVTFNEPLSKAGDFEVYVDGDKDDTINVSVNDDFEVGDDVLTLTLQEDLEGDKYYTLTIESAPEDLAGNDYEDYDDEEFDFNGTDLEPAEDFVGVKVLNPTKIEIVADDDFAATDAIVFYVGGDVVDALDHATVGATGSDYDQFVLNITDKQYALKEGTTYMIKIGSNFSQEFEGTLDGESVKSVTATTGGVAFEFKAYDKEADFTYYATVKSYHGSSSGTMTEDADINVTAKFDGTNDSLVNIVAADLSANTLEADDYITVTIYGVKDGIVQVISDLGTDTVE